MRKKDIEKEIETLEQKIKELRKLKTLQNEYDNPTLIITARGIAISNEIQKLTGIKDNTYVNFYPSDDGLIMATCEQVGFYVRQRTTTVHKNIKKDRLYICINKYYIDIFFGEMNQDSCKVFSIEKYKSRSNIFILKLIEEYKVKP